MAGLPVAVGLYTAFIPMLIYALLGSSRVFSVSSTATLAILAGTQLGLAVPDGDPASVTATATLAALVGAMLLAARVLRLGLARLHLHAVLTGFKVGIGLVIVLDQVQDCWACTSARKASCATCSASPAPARGVAADAGGGTGATCGADRHGAEVAAYAGAAGCSG